MSSSYRILCLSHDPAIELEPEWDGPTGPKGWTEAVTAAAMPEDDDRLAEHVTCDLLIGRYSYPLVEVCCPPMKRDVAKEFHSNGWHGNDQWVDLDWLRLLYAADRHLLRAAELGDEEDVELAEITQRLRRLGCWTPRRLRRLRQFLTLSTG